MNGEPITAPTTATDEQVHRSPRIDRIREALLGPDRAFEEEVAVALKCSRRQVQRLGLPFDKNGETRIYNLAGSREVIRRRLQPPDR